MTIRTLPELQQDFVDNSSRAITPTKLRDFADSVMAIGGTLYANDVILSVGTSWTAVDVFTNSIDTKGLTENLLNGEFAIDPGADGTYMVYSQLCLDSDQTGDLDLAIVKNGSLTPYQVTYRAVAGIKSPFPISGTGNLVAGDTIALALRAPAAATVTLVHGSLRLTRI